MPRNVMIVTGNVNGSEYPCGGRAFSIESELDAFVEELRSTPGYQGHRIDVGGTAPASVYVLTGNVNGSEYPSGGRMFGDEASARAAVPKLEAVDGCSGWKLEHGTDGGFQIIATGAEPPPARINVAELETDRVAAA